MQCGTSDWILDQKKDIRGKTDLYGIYKVVKYCTRVDILASMIMALWILKISTLGEALCIIFFKSKIISK